MKKMLIVDEEENIRLLYREEFEDEGYRVVVASTAEEALEILANEKPDIICLDIKLPGMDGIEFLEKVQGEGCEIPLIFCTGYGHYKQDFRVWGAHDYVLKSADLTELKDKVRGILFDDLCSMPARN